MRTLIALPLVVVALASMGASPHPPKRVNYAGIAWEATIEGAKARAVKEGRPILHLQTFGKLDDPYSCTNTRTLRTVLLADPEFKKLLQNEVVPSWEMIREVPKVTIDFRNGQKVTRTLKGNVAMYLCEPDGRVIDAFGGVVTPKDFVPVIRDSIRHLAGKTHAEVSAFHRIRARAFQVAGLNAGKTVAEAPLLIAPSKPRSKQSTSQDPRRLEFEAAAAQLFDASAEPMPMSASIRLGTGKTDGTPAELGMLAVQNESRMNLTAVRGVIHRWLASFDKLPSPTSAKDDMFETILHVPYKDPYLGLFDVELPGTPNPKG